MHRLDELAKHVDGRLKGDPSLQIEDVRPFDDALEGHLTLAGKPDLLGRLDECRAAAAIVPLDFLEAAADGGDASDLSGGSRAPALLGVAHPKLAFARILAFFRRRSFRSRGLSRQAFVGRQCRIEEPVSVDPGAFIGNQVHIGSETSIGAAAVLSDRVRVGRRCVIHPNVVLYPGVRLGDGVILHSGTVIGADGFGYVFDGSRQVKLEQTGTVMIEDDVEIGANCCVDRATFGATVVERGVKIDNLVHIAHNCRIGQNTVIVGCVGISGSVTLGKNCVVAGQSGFVDHVEVGDGVTIMMRTAVTKDVPSGSVVSGAPGRDHQQELKSQAALRNLPDLWKELRSLRRRVRELEDSRS